MTSPFWIIVSLLPLVGVVLVAAMNKKRDSPSQPGNRSGAILAGVGALFAAFLVAALLSYPGARRNGIARTHVAVSRETGSVAVSDETGETIVFSEGLPDVDVPAPEGARPESSRPDREDKGRASWLGQVVTGGAVALLITLAYLFLDAGTRGRYTGLLRFGSIGVFAACCALLWRFGPLAAMLE